MTPPSAHNAPPPPREYPDHAQNVSTHTTKSVAIEAGEHRYEFEPPACGEVTLRVGGLVLTVQRVHGEAEPVGQPDKPISEALAQWLRMLEAEHQSSDEIRKKRQTINWFAREQGWATLGDISTPSVVTAKASMAGRSTKTVVNKIIQLRRFLAHCKLCGWIVSNPAESIGLPRVIAGDHVRAFTRDEMNRLCSLAPAPRCHLYRFLAFTGLRKNEAKTLTWRYVFLDDERPHIMLPARSAKSRKQERVPLCSEAMESLRAAETPDVGPADAVFSFPARATLQRDLANAGIDRVDERGLGGGWHCFRRFFGTTLAQAGVSPVIAQRLTRHADVRTYVNSYVDDSQLGEDDALEAAMRGRAEVPGSTAQRSDSNPSSG